MVIRLRGRVIVAPEIRLVAGAEIVWGGVFAHRRWQRLLGRLAPRMFHAFGVEYEQATGRSWIVGIPYDEIVCVYRGLS